jgi:ATP-binding cassette subfamily B protein
LLIAFNPVVVLILVVTVIPGILLRFGLSRRQYNWNKQNANRARLISYLSGLLINATAAKEIRVNNVGPHIKARYEQNREQQNSEQRRLSIMGILLDLGIQASSILSVISVYSYVIYLTIQGQITIGQMVMYYQLFQRGQSLVQSITSSLTGFYENSLYATTVFEFMDLPPKLPRPEANTPIPFPDPIREGISFEDVTFRYPSSSSDVFTHLTLKICPGEVIALVGTNGAGKTTLVKLLCRLYDPTDGRITVDGIDLREFDIVQLRRHIGIIFQDYLGYFLSARDNIWFGDVSRPSRDGGVEEAAAIAEVDEKLKTLKHGFDTNLGRWLEDGAQLSGGEWQKVALSRMFFRDAPIIILDEPTSAIDAQAEFQLFTKFRKVVRGKIALLISHRMSTVQMADCIYILENGSVLESGSHDTLMAANGTYARLFKLQAQYYQLTNNAQDLGQ